MLVEASYDVSVITSSKEKTRKIEALSAKPLVGSVENSCFLYEAFKGADVVYTMIPPNMTSADWKAFIYGVGDNYVLQCGGLSSLYYYLEQE